MTFDNLLTLIEIFIGSLLIVLIPVLLGELYGKYRSKSYNEINQIPVGSVVGAALGLLAFMLAFTFQITSDRFNSRKELLLEEVTNIRTAHLRAGLLPEPFRSNSRKLLVEYVELRVMLANDANKLDYGMKRSQQILDTLWSYSEKMSVSDNSSVVFEYYTASINDLVNNYNHRVTMTLEYRIPDAIIWVLFVISFLSMLLMGYQFGISGKKSIKLNLLLAFIFAAVMFLILALDRPELGLIKLNQKPMFTLYNQLKNK